MSSTRDLVSAAISAALNSSVSLPCSSMEASTAARRSSSSRRYRSRSSRVRSCAVVEAAGRLFAVSGDERNSGAFVEQPHGGGDLGFVDGQFLSETGVYRLDG